LGTVPSPPLSFGAVEGLHADDLLNKSGHPHTLYDQACSRAMHGRKKLAAGSVNACDLRHINFDFLAEARGRVPRTFGFANPGTAKSAGEFQPTSTAILVNHDS
jgi:hypothetical protein